MIFARKIYTSFLLRISSNQLFALLINFNSTLKKRPITATFLRQTNIFRINQGSAYRYASEKSRVTNCILGFESRNDYLIDVYKLAQIEKPPKGTSIVDCGANIGDFYFASRKIFGDSFKYIGFEPSPKDFYCLAQNVPKSPLNVIHKIALWNEVNRVEFWLDTESASSSVIRPKRAKSSIQVEALPLCQAIDSADYVHLLKVEAEGAEPEVIQGVLPIINRVKYLVVDVSFERGEREESTEMPVIELLKQSEMELVYWHRGHRRMLMFQNKKALP